VQGDSSLGGACEILEDAKDTFAFKVSTRRGIQMEWRANIRGDRATGEFYASNLPLTAPAEDRVTGQFSMRIEPTMAPLSAGTYKAVTAGVRLFTSLFGSIFIPRTDRIDQRYGVPRGAYGLRSTRGRISVTKEGRLTRLRLVGPNHRPRIRWTRSRPALN